MKPTLSESLAKPRGGSFGNLLRRIKKDDTIPAYLMIAPMLIGFLLFTIYPIFYVIRWSFFDYDGFSGAIFIGLDNFVRLFSRDSSYWSAVFNTLVVALGKTVLEIPLALILAVLLNSNSKVNTFFRTFYFMPTIVSVAIVGLIFSILFGSYNGIVNTLLVKGGLAAANISWFGNKWLALGVIVLASVWSHFGINMVFFLMGLQSIPKELYECAEIDGANQVQQFIKVTLPMLKPILQIVLMLELVEGLKISDLALVLTNGQPGGQTELVMTYIYKYFFPTNAMSGGLVQYGYASALATVTAMLVGLVTVVYLKFSKKMSDIY